MRLNHVNAFSMARPFSVLVLAATGLAGLSENICWAVPIPLVNAGFEAGPLFSQIDNSGWIKASNESATYFYDNRYITTTEGANYASINQSGWIYRNSGHKILANTTYTASVDISDIGVSDKPGNQVLELYAGDPFSGGILVGQAILSEGDVPTWTHPDLGGPVQTPPWTTLMATYTSPSSGAAIGQDLWIRIVQGDSGRYEFVAWDNVQLSYIPEPAAASLLGIGALMFANRRRR